MSDDVKPLMLNQSKQQRHERTSVRRQTGDLNIRSIHKITNMPNKKEYDLR